MPSLKTGAQDPVVPGKPALPQSSLHPRVSFWEQTSCRDGPVKPPLGLDAMEQLWLR